MKEDNQWIKGIDLTTNADLTSISLIGYITNNTANTIEKSFKSLAATVK